jgi:hypothetical protein
MRKQQQVATKEVRRQLAPEEYVRPGVSLALVNKMHRVFNRLDTEKEGLVDLVRVRGMIAGLGLAHKTPRAADLLSSVIDPEAEEQKVDFESFMRLFGLAPEQTLSPD